MKNETAAYAEMSDAQLIQMFRRGEAPVIDYLMEKYDTAWDQDTTRPFIMENDSLMEGYRANPLDSLP